mmetsp:Transcript_15306/g.30091  ORF Transcript_15306/g.30091 Transcript_15306/m.30091 type:complete len:201 (-) Transcript_15306:10-612(-)
MRQPFYGPHDCAQFFFHWQKTIFPPRIELVSFSIKEALPLLLARQARNVLINYVFFPAYQLSHGDPATALFLYAATDSCVVNNEHLNNCDSVAWTQRELANVGEWYHFAPVIRIILKCLGQRCYYQVFVDFVETWGFGMTPDPYFFVIAAAFVRFALQLTIFPFSQYHPCQNDDSQSQPAELHLEKSGQWRYCCCCCCRR